VAGEGIGFELLIEDHMSSPAAQIRSQIFSLREEMIRLKDVRLDSKMRGEADAFKAAGAELSKLGLDAQKAKLELDRLEAAEPARSRGKAHLEGGFLGELKQDMFGTITAATLTAHAIETLVEGVIEFTRSVVEAVAEAGLEVAKFAIEASEMRENATGAYEAMTGSADAGEALYKQIEAVAVGGHMAIGRAQTMAQSLMAEGVKQADTVAATVQAIGVLERVGPQGAAERLQRIIARSMASGHFEVQARTLSGVSNLPDLMDDISKRLHKPVATIEAEMKAGKIAADVGIDAIVDSVNWGKLGDIAQKRMTLKDVWTDFGNAFTRMLDDINVRPLLDALENIVWVLNGGAQGASDFKDGLKSAMDSSASWVGARINDITVAFLQLELYYLDHKAAFDKMWSSFNDSMNQVKWEDLIPKIETVGEAIYTIAKAVQLVASAALAVVDAFSRTNAQSMAIAAGASAQDFPDLGGDDIPGPQYDMRNDVAPAAAPEQPLSPIAAPAHAEGGLVLAPAPGEVLASVAPGEIILPRGSDAAGGSGSSKTVHVDVGGIHVHVSGKPDKDLQQQIESLSAHALEDAFERVALELGTEAA
jgi:hypothetical protein